MADLLSIIAIAASVGFGLGFWLGWRVGYAEGYREGDSDGWFRCYEGFAREERDRRGQP